VDVYDEEGKPVRGGKGELVCVKPFPSMPVMFWNDPDGSKYHNAYFARFPGIWCHGDFAEITAHGGMIIHGRSDATLNPGGVRIGTAEIYAQVEQVPEVIEALAIGQDWDGDVRVVLFVQAPPRRVARRGALCAKIRKADPRGRLAPPCAGEDRRGGRHSAHQVRQDHRACGARRGAWPRGEEQGGARQPGSAGAYRDITEGVTLPNSGRDVRLVQRA
jgi:acyl-CoA synthetase (AMP-forming)/AMP-acid ligase II